MSGSPEGSRPEPIPGQAEATLAAFKRADAAIDWKGGRIHAYYISSQIGDLTMRLVPQDAFETHRGIVEGHGEFEIGMIRIYSTDRSLLRDWLILPDGDIWTCGVNRAHPDLLELDTLKHPTTKELIRDRGMLMDAVAVKAGLFIDPKTGEYKTEPIIINSRGNTLEDSGFDSDENRTARQALTTHLV